MPYQKNGKRDYKREYKEYHGKEGAKKDRAKRVKARRAMEKSGRATKGDGKDVGHKKPLRKGGGNTKSNLKMQSKSSNRSHSINKAKKGSRKPKSSVNSRRRK